jgi:hypothetical protein
MIGSPSWAIKLFGVLGGGYFISGVPLAYQHYMLLAMVMSALPFTMLLELCVL